VSVSFKPCESWGGAHGFGAWFLTWRTKYNYALFGKDKMRKACESSIHSVAQRHGWKVLGLSVMPKVVHLVIAGPPKGSDFFAHAIKGASAYDLFRAEPRLRLRYTRGHLWAKKYDARPAAGDLTRILQYLKEPHNDPLQKQLNHWGS